MTIDILLKYISTHLLYIISTINLSPLRYFIILLLSSQLLKKIFFWFYSYLSYFENFNCIIYTKSDTFDLIGCIFFLFLSLVYLYNKYKKPSSSLKDERVYFFLIVYLFVLICLMWLNIGLISSNNAKRSSKGLTELTLYVFSTKST